MGADAPLGRTGGPGPVDGAPGADGALVEVARAAVAGSRARGGGGDWTVAVEGSWCTVRPPGREPPAQGWELHVGAASSVAFEVLSAVAAAVADDPCPFAFAADRGILHGINAHDCAMESSGKFITVRPGGDEQFRRLAAELHLATAGMPGPVIPTARPYRPGSLVHYRYGASAARPVLGNDGVYRPVLRTPGGDLVEDRPGRRPPWVADPVEGAGSATGGRPAPAGVRVPAQPGPGARRGGGGGLLGGRWARAGALRHDAGGGVFLGTDRATGGEVVVTQARAHIEVDRTGTDARTELRRRAALLDRLTGSGLAPRVHALLERPDALFLVQERLPGRPLDDWVADRLRPDGTPGVPWTEAGPLALALLDLVERAHRHGVALPGLAPGHVLVAPDGRPCLTSLRGAAPAAIGADAPDLSALGGLYFLLATGHLPPRPPAGSAAERQGSGLTAGGREPAPTVFPSQPPDRLLELAARAGGTARRLAPLVRGLRSPDGGRCWGPARVRAALAAEPSPVPAAPVVPPSLDRLLHDGLRHLAHCAAPHRSDRLWPTGPEGLRTDPCNVQHGAAGVLALLARAAGTAPLPVPARDRARATAAVAAAWVERRCAAEPVVLPGLYYGRSGTAWALFDAAAALGDPGLAERAAGLAARVPLGCPAPGLAHGAAGAGLVQLRAHRATGARLFLDRTARCVRELLAAAQDGPGGTLWPVPADFDSATAGTARLGHADGVAGIGAFLLAAATVLAADGRTGHAATARAARAGADRAARTLAATVRRDGAAARWPRHPDDPGHVRLAHGCEGAAGVGAFLLRYWRATGDESARDLALAAGQAVLDDRWHCGTGACHGLAGDGEYLLDLAGATGRGRFRQGAHRLAALIAARAALRHGLLLLPDAGGTGWATGTAGPLAFLLRLRHGGPRLWSLPEE
ncbi:lanthionine synthetase-like protein [Kitasatospora cineracea]|uniref:Lanthionine synthetase-like protein n=1 Tax=Kitasatospora cineracea TaxID=88074 RepID=A0A8G1XD22_9ACTN|nr:lanthionine synthetase-like protein [Kitasatospora cineracea]